MPRVEPSGAVRVERSRAVYTVLYRMRHRNSHVCTHSVGDTGPPGPCGERRKREREKGEEEEGKEAAPQQPAAPSAADRFIEWHVPIRSNVVLYFSASRREYFFVDGKKPRCRISLIRSSERDRA